MFNKILTGLVYINSVGIVHFFKDKKNLEKDEEDERKNNLVCRFVLDGAGRKIGESVAIDNDLLIIKKGSKYLGVPLKHIEEDKKTLLVKGLVEQENAEAMGERWRQASFKEIEYSDDE